MSGGLARFVIRRLCGAAIFILIVSSGALLLVRLAPGDAATDLALTVGDPGAVAEARTRLGLDRSPVAQLGTWLAGLSRFDLGQSSRYGRPVAGLVADRMANTAMLAGIALLAATLIGVPLGVFTGTRSRDPLARLVAFISIVLVACPPIIGTLGLLFLAATRGWLSVSTLALPVLALALPIAAALERLQSQAAAEAMTAPDLLAAAARGVPHHRLVWMHALKASLRPVLGVYGIVIATLFSGSVAVETITSWPGIGRLMLDALLSRDLFLVAGCALAGAIMIAVGNLVADLLRAAIDPRVREAA